MGGSAIRAGRAFVELFADDSKLNKTLDQVGRRMQRFGAGLLKISLPLASAFGAATLAFAKFGDQLDKMSQRTGVSAEKLSELKFAAEQSGSSLEGLGTGLRGMARFLLDAERGLSTQLDTLKRLGISMADLEDKTPEERLMVFADAIAGVEDPSEKAALAMKVFGRAGEELVPMLSLGSSGIRKLTDEARESGQTIDEEAKAAAVEFTDALNKLVQTLKGVVIQIGGAVTPALTDLIELLQPLVTSTVGWVKENKPLVATLAAIAGVLTGAGFVLIVGGQLAMSLNAIAVAAGRAGAGFTGMGTGATSAATGVKSLNGALATTAKLIKGLGILSFKELEDPKQILDRLRSESADEAMSNRKQARRDKLRQRQQDRADRPAAAAPGKQLSGPFALDFGILDKGPAPADRFEMQRKKDVLAQERMEQEREKRERAQQELQRAAVERLDQQISAASAVEAARQAIVNFTQHAASTPLASFQGGSQDGRSLIKEALTGRQSQAEKALKEAQKQTRDLEAIRKALEKTPVILSSTDT